jgi:hypothetical protein
LPLEPAILLQVCGNFGQPAPHRDPRLRGEPGRQPPLQRHHMMPAFVELRAAAAGQRPLQHPAVHGMKELAYLSSAIASINVWNRLGVAYRWTPPARQKTVHAAAS